MVRAEIVYATPEAAINAKLLLPSTLIPAGTIVVQVDAAGTMIRTYSGCALNSVNPVTNGCTLTIEYVYDTSGVS